MGKDILAHRSIGFRLRPDGFIAFSSVPGHIHHGGKAQRKLLPQGGKETMRLKLLCWVISY